MTASTHRRFSVSFALLGALLIDINTVNYYLVIVLLVTFSKFGGLFPDLDHHWHSVKEKTDLNWIINKILRLTGAKHRSWQTHSWDIAIIFAIIAWTLPEILYTKYSVISVVDKEVIKIMLLGYSLGWFSHLFGDMLNNAGVRLVCWNKFKIKLVPKKLFSLKFKTGEDWESFCSSFEKYINRLLGILVVIYPLIK